MFLPRLEPVLPDNLPREVDEEVLLKQLEEAAEAQVLFFGRASVFLVGDWLVHQPLHASSTQSLAVRNHEPVKTTIGLKKAASPEPVHQATETEEDDDEDTSSQIDDEPGMLQGCAATRLVWVVACVWVSGRRNLWGGVVCCCRVHEGARVHHQPYGATTVNEEEDFMGSDMDDA